MHTANEPNQPHKFLEGMVIAQVDEKYACA